MKWVQKLNTRKMQKDSKIRGNYAKNRENWPKIGEIRKIKIKYSKIRRNSIKIGGQKIGKNRQKFGGPKSRKSRGPENPENSKPPKNLHHFIVRTFYRN